MIAQLSSRRSSTAVAPATTADRTIGRSGPPGQRRSVSSVLLCLLALAMLAAACGGGGQDQSAEDLGFSADDNGGEGQDTTSSTSDRSDTDQQSEADEGSEDDESTSDSATTATPPTTAGSGLGPVQTFPVASGGDPDAIYIGRIGSLEPNEQLVAGAAVPPEAGPGILPLTGQRGEVADRPAAVVKIDNGTAAYPHQGLNAADIVIEEEVEGGVTRFAAVFHSTASIVGPVRSGRTTDLSLISGLGDPLLLYSGANQITEGILRGNPAIQNRSFDSAPGGYWRDGDRQRPSDLFSDTAPHWASASGGPPPAQFHYRDFNEPVPGVEDDEVTIAYPASTARWRWDGEQWLRWQRSDPHVLVSLEQVSAANVVVIEAEELATGMVDANGGAVPEFFFVGSGTATVFTDGKRIEGTWTRPSLNSVATLTSGPGVPIELTPGRTWIQLVAAGSGQMR